MDQEQPQNAGLEDDGKRPQVPPPSNAVWYCPSRWLLAHHDPRADIATTGAHLCLADLNSDGESLLALVDFKRRGQQASSSQPTPPYTCRLRVYRGQRLIYSHFLDDMPAALLATPLLQRPPQPTKTANHLALAINNHIYFYHRLQPAQRLELADEQQILNSLNKSELDAWRMVRQDEVDADTLHELLAGLSNELGPQELTSHSQNFLSLGSREARRAYLQMWRARAAYGVNCASDTSKTSQGEFMSMDTVCCMAARLVPDAARSAQGLAATGLVLGTEDRHLLVYRLLSPAEAPQKRACHHHQLERAHRLPAAPDHLLVERRPRSRRLNPEGSDQTTTCYRILVSCRNARIYSLDAELNKKEQVQQQQPRQLLSLKAPVLAMVWTGDEDSSLLQEPDFVVASADRKCCCFNSQTGQCKWWLELELPATSLVALPLPGDAGLVGVASRANRVDFYVAATGRIVDSIYLARDHCQAMAFGRFGREDNCLCIITSAGHLLIFIMKRQAKFGHGQCLSSAASHAAQLLKQAASLSSALNKEEETTLSQLNTEAPSLPSAFKLTKSAASSGGSELEALEMLQREHDCDETSAGMSKSTLDAHLREPLLQVPPKSRDFVDQIWDQSRLATDASRLFARHMLRLRHQLERTMADRRQLAQQQAPDSDGNRLALVRVTGLGNTYRAVLSLRLSLRPWRRHLLSARKGTRAPLQVLVSVGSQSQESPDQVRPASLVVEAATGAEAERDQWRLERLVELRLVRGRRRLRDQVGQQQQPHQQEQTDGETDGSVSVELLVLLAADSSFWRARLPAARLQRPLFISSVNIPTC